MIRYVISDKENNIVGVTECSRIKELTPNKVTKVKDCPDGAVGNAKLIKGKVTFNEQD